ncbi:hypothetical protein ACFPYJ_14285 [Paenibacillus solisilvae]|uniref:Uncharacterized protein n=1 Tax=Paenibacillus solisilvae TaxID=2486751 RepID=A0ABW0W0K6_9BACL
MNKKRLVLLLALAFVLVIVALYIRGCNPIESFDTNIDSVESNRFQVDCSEEVNKNKSGAINDIGYICSVLLTEETKFQDEAGNPLGVQHFKSGDSIRVILKKRQYITEEKRDITAKEIILLHKRDS